MTAVRAQSSDSDLGPAVLACFETWARRNEIDDPTGQHVVRFCAEMWVTGKFPGDLGIPTVWGMLRTAGAFAIRK